MILLVLISNILLWIFVLGLAFLLLGNLRNHRLLAWKVQQLEMTAPSRSQRNGLRIGKRAPDFTLPDISGRQFSLNEYAGRKVLLVFTKSGCAPCDAVMPDLIALKKESTVELLIVNQGKPDKASPFAEAEFPVLIQEGIEVSRQYEMFAAPFAFLIDEQGIIRSKGIVNNKEHIGFILSTGSVAVRELNAETQTSEVAVGSSWASAK